MPLLTRDGQERVVKLLISEGLVFVDDIKAVQAEVEKTKQPILATLTSKK